MTKHTPGHTPGPWKVDKELNSFRGQWLIAIDVGDRGRGMAVAETIGGTGDERANARLIAAAPDLLNALQAIVKSLADQDDEGMIEHAQQMIDARAAIAKAEGQA